MDTVTALQQNILEGGNTLLRLMRQNGAFMALLEPFGKWYGKKVQARIKAVTPQKCDAEVICVGNITMGGVGKTPVAISIAEKLIAGGKNPVFLTRGYKGKLKDVVIPKGSSSYTAEQVGDEPLLLARVAPVVVDADRVRGANTAIDEYKADVIIMDDGFQNPSLHKDKSFLVFDGKSGIGNGKIFPAGDLRETLEDGLKRADVVIIVGNDYSHLEGKVRSLSSDITILNAKTVVDEAVANELNGKDVFAFAGIGKPDKFLATLSSIGAKVVGSKFFQDHHFYSDTDIAELTSLAGKTGGVLVTTEKDAVKLPSSFLAAVKVVPIKIVCEYLVKAKATNE